MGPYIGSLGIDLNDGLPPGVTPNDAGDGDGNPSDPLSATANNLQNFPVLASAIASSHTTFLQGSLNSTPNSTFRIEFFASDAADPSGYGEGKTYLGFKQVVTDAAGNAFFTATTASDGLQLIPADHTVVTATATDASGNTSEFSLTQAIVFNRDPVADHDLTYATDEDTPLHIAAAGVLGNDIDPDGDALTATRVSGPFHGSLALNPNGSFNYTPNPSYNGSDYFTYQPSDGRGGTSDVVTAQITVRPVNDVPEVVAGVLKITGTAAQPPVAAAFAVAAASSARAIGDDVIQVNLVQAILAPGTPRVPAVKVKINDNSFGPFALDSFSSILVDALSGKDKITIDKDILKPTKLLGGDGDDTIMGGGGDDLITVGLGNNTIFGNKGNDTITVNGNGANTISGGAGNDTVTVGGAGVNILDGGSGNDQLVGGTGSDFLIGGNGKDSLTGGAGRDILIGGTTKLSPEDIDAVLASWASGAVNPLLDASKISNDSDADILLGGEDADWFLIFGTDSSDFDSSTDKKNFLP